MKGKYIIFSLLLFIGFTGMSQTASILNAEKPEDIGKSKTDAEDNTEGGPLEYGYVDDRDVLWSKGTWEIIDLNERVNFPLYYPVDTMNIASNRRSLYDVLIRAIKNGKIENIYADSYFTEKRTLKDIRATISRVDTTDYGIEQYNAGQEVDEQFIDRRDLGAADIVQYKIRGIWYFDKRQAELKYRILGIAPRAPDVNFIDDSELNDLVDLFWVWYPDARDALYEAKAYIGNNTVISYDQLLNARRFNSVIFKEDNVQGDRAINDYIVDNSFMQLLESERIKEQIRNFEQDMWNY
ncbi:type IX secretion system ring protein PorN/GldN [Zunongwangia sp. HGR-M22]|uniref:type IX secretion system ring protein PorN/GldN n=1 Tax=Zunongwangia sp. HGR-M22 TaxID=3015168 RepID=UPI0022DDB7C5|nr:gliding motility protein GldN [Zunongwangia sp. HGR-M22]WBL25198.1 gliding motility protein GldN [Zunongwangia sp. HGR-M22]